MYYKRAEIFLFIPFLIIGSVAWGQDRDESGRRVKIEIGGMVGYRLVGQGYGDEGFEEKTHWYGGVVGGGEISLKWPVGEHLRLGFRLMGSVGSLSHPCESISCGYGASEEGDVAPANAAEPEDLASECVCSYRTYASGFISLPFVLDVVFADWIWMDVNVGFLLPIDTNREVLPGLQGGVGLGFSILNTRVVNPYLRIGGDVVWHAGVGVFPQLSLGVRF